MSASLVGSEMCIRDRCGGPLWAPPGSTDQRRCEQLKTNRSGAMVLSLAVSYTHLTLPTICSV
eukprot:3373528-Alexandrium_andersonii.AAC.1